MFPSVKEIIPISEFFFPNFLLEMGMLAVAVYVWCTVVCLYLQGAWSCTGEQRMQETQHTDTLLKMHFHPAEWLPTSSGAHSGRPSLVSSQMSTVCALRLSCTEKQNYVMGNAKESLF